jgi:hypothetical protein
VAEVPHQGAAIRAKIEAARATSPCRHTLPPDRLSTTFPRTLKRSDSFMALLPQSCQKQNKYGAILKSIEFYLARLFPESVSIRFELSQNATYATVW